MVFGFGSFSGFSGEFDSWEEVYRFLWFVVFDVFYFGESFVKSDGVFMEIVEDVVVFFFVKFV